MAVHDRLRQAGGAGGVQDVERVVERQRGEGERFVGRRGQLGPAIRSLRVEVAQGHRVSQAGQRRLDRGHLGAPVDVLAAVAVAVDRHQHRRLDLLPTVDDAAGAELRGAGGEDRADAGRGQQQDQCLRDVRAVRRHPVAGHHTEPAQPGRHPAHLLAQLVRSQRDRIPGLRPGRHHRINTGQPRGTKQVLGVVEPHVGEPAGAGHRRRRQHPRLRHRVTDREVVPDGAPEAGQIGDRPLPQQLVAVEGEPPLALQPTQVVADPGLLPYPLRWAPQPLARAHPGVPSPTCRRAVAPYLGHSAPTAAGRVRAGDRTASPRVGLAGARPGGRR